MHGREALFSEPRTLKEVIERFKEQLATASALENERRHLAISRDRLLAIDKFPDCNEGAVSDGFPLDLRIHQDTARYREGSQIAASSGDVPVVEVQPGISSRPVQTEDFQNHAANCTCEGHHERLHRDTNKYKCEECFRSFKYPSNLSVHKERSFVCTTCHKGFSTHSDLTVQEITHKENVLPVEGCSARKPASS